MRLRTENEARWAYGLEYTYGLQILHRQGSLTEIDKGSEKPFCSKCCERLGALGTDQVRAEERARRSVAVREINEWLEKLDPLPFVVGYYQPNDGDFDTHYHAERDLLTVIHFDSIDDLYRQLPRGCWKEKESMVKIGDGSGPGQFYVKETVKYFIIDNHSIGALSHKIDTGSDG